MLLPSHTPPLGLPRDGNAEIGAGVAHQSEQAFGAGIDRLGRASEAAVHFDATSCDAMTSLASVAIRSRQLWRWRCSIRRAGGN